MSDDDLDAYAAGELAPEAERDARIHLSHCSDCRARVEELEATMAQLSMARSTMRLLAPPPATLDRARLLMRQVRPDLFRAPAGTHRGMTNLRELVATLVFDSQQALAFGGLRSSVASTRQLSYESVLADLDLQIAPLEAPGGGERRWRVMGQLTTDTPAPGLIAEISPLPEQAEPADRENGTALTAPLDEGGYFTVELTAERYALRIPLGDSILRFPDLDLR
jgi:hypothetical protein